MGSRHNAPGGGGGAALWHRRFVVAGDPRAGLNPWALSASLIGAPEDGARGVRLPCARSGAAIVGGRHLRHATGQNPRHAVALVSTGALMCLSAYLALHGTRRTVPFAECPSASDPPGPSRHGGLLDERRLRLMMPTAYLINGARAEIIDEAALYRALARGGLAGAAIDVWYRYPTTSGTTAPATQPFQGLANVIMTPHVSCWTEDMLDARATLIATNIERTVRGEPPLSAVDACS